MRALVILSGCGHLDGTEITEAVSAMIALDRAGVKIAYGAPAGDQRDVVDHQRREPVPGKVRDILAESARIARGDIRELSRADAAEFDFLVFPGGFGAAKNLCSFAVDGPECTVNAEVERLIVEAHTLKKPIAAICIAPVLLAKVLGARGAAPLLTIGNDAGTAAALEAMGARHQPCRVTDCVVDETNRLVTTPAYMLGPGPAKVSEGIGRCIEALIRLAHD